MCEQLECLAWKTLHPNSLFHWRVAKRLAFLGSTQLNGPGLPCCRSLVKLRLQHHEHYNVASDERHV